MSVTKKNKQEILKQVAELLDAKDCVVRVQREMTPEQTNAAPSDNFIVGKRVTIIVVGTT